jgi:uncharacterized protein YndB with AHSA1/START domain
MCNHSVALYATYRLRIEGGAVEVEREIVVPAPVDEVWAALTEAERLEEWFANEVELDPVEGDKGSFRWDDGDERSAVVIEAVPERRFVFDWDESPGSTSRVAIELEPVEDGTRVRVTETRGAGWGSALALRALARAPL